MASFFTATDSQHQRWGFRHTEEKMFLAQKQACSGRVLAWLGCRSSFIGDPGAKCSGGTLRIFTKNQNQGRGGLWKPSRMGNPLEQSAGSTAVWISRSQKRARFIHTALELAAMNSPKPNGRILSKPATFFQTVVLPFNTYATLLAFLGSPVYV